MKYEKPEVEIVKFESEGFMTGSGNMIINGYCDSYNFPGALGNMGYSCGQYQQGASCNPYTTNGYTCYGYNGTNCTSYVYAANGKTYGNYHQKCGHF